MFKKVYTMASQSWERKYVVALQKKSMYMYMYICLTCQIKHSIANDSYMYMYIVHVYNHSEQNH